MLCPSHPHCITVSFVLCRRYGNQQHSGRICLGCSADCWRQNLRHKGADSCCKSGLLVAKRGTKGLLIIMIVIISKAQILKKPWELSKECDGRRGSGLMYMYKNQMCTLSLSLFLSFLQQITHTHTHIHTQIQTHLNRQNVKNGRKGRKKETLPYSYQSVKTDACDPAMCTLSRGCVLNSPTCEPPKNDEINIAVLLL